MIKTWINKDKGNDKIIAMSDDMIFKANPKLDKIQNCITKIESNDIDASILSIPFSYLRGIQYQEGKKYIQVLFGQESEEHLTILDDNERFKLFNYFKENIPDTQYSFEEFSSLKSAKKPLIALLITSLLYIWTLYLAIQIENGNDYELIGNGRSITAIVLGLAYLGIFKVTLIFGSLISIATWSIIRKVKNKPKVHSLIMLR